MPGAPSTFTYNNASLDNFLMSLGFGMGYRFCAIEITNDTSTVTTISICGGISAYVNRTSTGLYTITFEDQFKLTPFVGATARNKAHQAHCYSASTKGCKVYTLAYAGAAWSLSNIASFTVTVFGR